MMALARGPGLPTTDAVFEAVFDSVSAGIVVLDVDGSVVLANQGASRILGIPPDRLVGTNARDAHWRWITEDGSPLPADKLPGMRTSRTGRPRRGVTVGMTRPDGEPAWISINAAPLPGDGPPHQVVVSFVDISNELRSRAELERRHQLLRAAHDINDGILQRLVLASYAAREEQAGAARAIEEALLEARRLISDLLAEAESLEPGRLSRVRPAG
jgi:PAS domain S-box-containing protein